MMPSKSVVRPEGRAAAHVPVFKKLVLRKPVKARMVYRVKQATERKGWDPRKVNITRKVAATRAATATLVVKR